MSAARSQNARVLRALQNRGKRGITQLDFVPPLVVDGGTPVLRLPARINELRRRGHAIRSRLTTTAGGARVALYTLDDELSPGQPCAHGDAHAEPEPLAPELAEPRRPMSPYDPEVEA